jgi:thymidylate kinase
MTIDEALTWLSVLPQPTKTFFLDIDPRTVLETRVDSVHDHSSDLKWQTYKRDRYTILATMFSDRIIKIDATQEPDIITTKIAGIIADNVSFL